MTKMLRSALLMGAAMAALPAAASAQAASYSIAQAEAGARAYQTSCAMCHGADLTGLGDSPPLAGPFFTSNWRGTPVTQLIGFVRENMPMTAPGSLTEEGAVALVAYLLSMNETQVGDAALTASSTGVIEFGKP